MNSVDPGFLEMVRQLAKMAPSDREYVLKELDDEETRRLQRYLSPLNETTISPALAQLVAECADGGVPDGLSVRAAAAVRKAAEEQTDRLPVDSGPAEAGATGWRNRLNSFRMKR